MALVICSFEGCYSQRFPCSSLTFFQLPNDEPRRTQWILNSGNKQLQNLKPNQKRYFCEKHFNKKDIRPHFYRKLLYKHAVPLPYMSDIVSTTTTGSADGKSFEDWYELEAEVNDSTTGSTDGRNFEVFDELEEEVNDSEEAFITDYNQINGISDVEYDDDSIECLDMSSNDVDFVIDESDENDYILVHEIQPPAKENCASLALTTNSEAENYAIDTVLPTIPIAVDQHPKSPAATSSTIITSSASSTTTDTINLTTTETQIDVATTTAELINSDNEDNKEPTAADKSYESDKHFALSLVDYFQRLNARKKAQAKINILSYLAALDQDNDVKL